MNYAVDNSNNIESLVKQIKEKKPKRILLQLPDGLKTMAVKIVEAIERQGIEVFLSAEPCYGACDLRDEEASKMQCNLLVHVGHNKFYKSVRTSIPVLYYSWEIVADISNVDFSVIKEKRIGLLTTVQHMSLIEHASALLKKAGKEPVSAGQILGCWTENAERIRNRVDAFLFIGSGSFHPLGIRDKKVYSLNLEKNAVELIDTAKMEKKRLANIYKCKDAKSFGILVSTKPGQFDMGRAEAIKKILEKKDKKAYVLIMDEISNEKLECIRVDAFINTACPRIEDLGKPFINADDVEEFLNW